MENRAEIEMFTTLFWKKIWTWTKHHWYWPVIIVLLVFSTIAGTRAKEKMFGLLLKQRENYQKEIEIIEKANKEKDEQKEVVVSEYKEEVNKIEKEHNIKLEELAEEKQKDLVDTIEKNKDKPDNLAKEIAKILSAKYHEENR